MLNSAVAIIRSEVVAPHVRITPRWPLCGVVCAMAFRFDGRRLTLVRLTAQTLEKAYAWRYIA